MTTILIILVTIILVILSVVKSVDEYEGQDHFGAYDDENSERKT